MSEEWRPVPGKEGRYEASSEGRVRSLMFNNRTTMQVRQEPLILKQSVRGNYLKLQQDNKILREALQAVDDWLTPRNGSLKLFQIERLVADALEQTKPKAGAEGAGRWATSCD